jgi:spermidine synthase
LLGGNDDIGRMYAFDLLGACAGALLVVPLMMVIPTPALAMGVALLPLAAVVLLGGPRLPAAVLALVIVAVIIHGGALHFRVTKEYAESGNLRPIYVRWTPTARLAVFASIPWKPTSAFGWGMGSKAAAAPGPEQMWLEQDGSAGTPITAFDGDLSAVEHLRFDVTSVGYEWRTPKRVAIVGAGGGRDILTALASGAGDIEAIEINAGIVDALRGRFREFSGGVYDLPGVHTIVGEGRSVLTRSEGGYDLVQISMIDSWAATAAGAYALSENNLYTLEAYRLYLSKLSDRGVVATSRWAGPTFGFEVMRLLFLARAALGDDASPEKHIALVRAGRVGTVLLSKSELSDDDVSALVRICEARGLMLMYPPTGDGPNAVSQLFERGAAAYEEQGVRMEPPTDDRPFFFQVLSPWRAKVPDIAGQLGVNAQGVVALRLLMIAMTIIAMVLFFAPFALRRPLSAAPGFWRGSIFFTAIGLAFMFVEVAWLQRFVRYLGHPSLATAAALGFMLLGAGVGSMVSGRVGLERWQRRGYLLAVVVALLNAAMASVFDRSLGMPLALRIVVTGLFLLPAGVLMGFMFPLGMLRFAALGTRRAWFWALNGAAGVLASVMSLALAIELGFSRVAYLGTAIYLVAWWALGDSAPSAPGMGRLRRA